VGRFALPLTVNQCPLAERLSKSCHASASRSSWYQAQQPGASLASRSDVSLSTLAQYPSSFSLSLRFALSRLFFRSRAHHCIAVKPQGTPCASMSRPHTTFNPRVPRPYMPTTPQSLL